MPLVPEGRWWIMAMFSLWIMAGIPISNRVDTTAPSPNDVNSSDGNSLIATILDYVCVWTLRVSLKPVFQRFAHPASPR